jgi:acyl carrier protein
MIYMIEHHGVHHKLTELFAKKLNLEVSSVDTDLVGTGLLDSLALVELLAQLEETFGLLVSTPVLWPGARRWSKRYKRLRWLTVFIHLKTGIEDELDTPIYQE